MSEAPIAARLTAQGLSGPPLAGPVEVAERLLAVQGQDPRGARLAVRSRAEGTAASDVDRALSEDRSLLITWLNRGTLHLVRSEDYPWLQALTTPPLITSSAYRLTREGLTEADGERAMKTIERALTAEGPLTRAQLRERLDGAGVRTEGQALIHLLFMAALRGIAVRGPMAGKEHAYVLTRDWLGPQPEVDREAALAELARRYLIGHGPADDRDLARWAGLPLRDARLGLSALGDRLRVSEDGLVSLTGAPRVAGPPPPRLLGAFEPVLMGWCSRTAVLGEHDQRIVTGGIFRAFAFAPGPGHGGGQPVAVWKLGRSGVELDPLRPLDSSLSDALERDGERVMRFLGRV